MSKQKLSLLFQLSYVELVMAVLSRALVGASQNDGEIQREISAFAEGYLIRMCVLPETPSFTVRVNGNNTLSLDQSNDAVDLSINFKHITHAFSIFSFQEGTARSFANDRMIVDGNLSDAIRFVRCINKLEALILPKPIAQLAVKRYPNISLKEKLSLSLPIYSSVAKQSINIINIRSLKKWQNRIMNFSAQ